MNEKLKPCPFCGEEEVEWREDKEDIYCPACETSFRSIHIFKDHTIDAWNRRPNMTEKLKPCPFCGCPHIEKHKEKYIDRFTHKEINVYAIRCMNCGNRTDYYLKVYRDQAITAWQQRTNLWWKRIKRYLFGVRYADDVALLLKQDGGQWDD